MLSCVHTLQARRTSFSESKDMTSTPTIGEHDLRVITFFTIGRSSPCTVTRLAIWPKPKRTSLNELVKYCTLVQSIICKMTRKALSSMKISSHVWPKSRELLESDMNKILKSHSLFELRSFLVHQGESNLQVNMQHSTTNLTLQDTHHLCKHD